MRHVKITCIANNPVYYSNQRITSVALVAVLDKDDPVNTLKKVSGNHPFMFLDLQSYSEDLEESSEDFNIEDWEFQFDYSSREDGSYLVVEEVDITEEEYINILGK
jgi:hypothetical protein